MLNLPGLRNTDFSCQIRRLAEARSFSNPVGACVACICLASQAPCRVPQFCTDSRALDGSFWHRLESMVGGSDTVLARIQQIAAIGTAVMSAPYHRAFADAYGGPKNPTRGAKLGIIKMIYCCTTDSVTLRTLCRSNLPFKQFFLSWAGGYFSDASSQPRPLPRSRPVSLHVCSKKLPVNPIVAYVIEGGGGWYRPAA